MTFLKNTIRDSFYCKYFLPSVYLSSSVGLAARVGAQAGFATSRTLGCAQVGFATSRTLGCAQVGFATSRTLGCAQVGFATSWTLGLGFSIDFGFIVKLSRIVFFRNVKFHPEFHDPWIAFFRKPKMFTHR